MLIAVAACGQPTNTLRFSVSFGIGGESADLNTRVYSLLTRELRSLKDVDVVDHGGDFVFNIVAMQLDNQQGSRTGYAISVATLSRDSSQILRTMIDTNSIRGKLLYSCTSNCVDFVDHQLYAFSPDMLKDTCEQIIATFDTNVLSPRRLASPLLLANLSPPPTNVVDVVSNSVISSPK